MNKLIDQFHECFVFFPSIALLKYVKDGKCHTLCEFSLLTDFTCRWLHK